MRRTEYLVLMALMLGGFLSWSSLFAQPVPGALPETPPAEERGDTTPTTLWGLVRQGGWTMVPLGLLSATAVGLIIFGWAATSPGKVLAVRVLPSLQEEVTRLHLQQARDLCSATPCLLTNTLAAGLERLSDGILDVSSMEKAMEEASVHEVTAGLKPINYLSIIAQIAPMLGLLGTVSGMIRAFQKIGMGGMGKPELLAADIGEAMVTTATGLIIGIPAMFFYFYLKTRYLSSVSEMSRLLGNLCHQLVSAARRGEESASIGGPPSGSGGAA